MYEFILRSLKKYEELNKEVYYITLTSSNGALNRDVGCDFLMLWRRMKKVCPKAECFFVVVESDGVVRPHIHFLVVDFYYSKNWFEKQWGLVHGHCGSHLHKSLVDYRLSVELAVYLSTQHGVVSEVNCSEGWF